MKDLLTVAAMFLSGLAGGQTSEPRPAQPGRVEAPAAAAWEIGPIIRGRNYSVGMPLHPARADEGWTIHFPYPSAQAGQVHYVTFRPGPLRDRTRIVVHYRIDAAPGARFVSVEMPERPATISLYLQRRGDNWTARGRFDRYRWYAPAQSVAVLTPGEHEMIVDLGDPAWRSVMGTAASADPRGFAEALADTDRIGIVLGNIKRRGHGVYATGPSRLTITGFEII